MESSEICTRIIRNFKNQFPDEDLEVLLSGKYRLGNCFRWGHTPEGYYFWRNCFNRFLYTTNDFVRFIKKYGNIPITFINLKNMLDSELALLIVQRFKEQYPTKDWRCLLKVGHSICSAFSWCETPEGVEFWNKLDNQIRNLSKFLRENLSFTEEKFVDLQLFI